MYLSKLTKYSGKSTVISNQNNGKIIFGNFDNISISGYASSSRLIWIRPAAFKGTPLTCNNICISMCKHLGWFSLKRNVIFSIHFIAHANLLQNLRMIWEGLFTFVSTAFDDECTKIRIIATISPHMFCVTGSVGQSRMQRNIFHLPNPVPWKIHGFFQLDLCQTQHSQREIDRHVGNAVAIK